MRADAVALLVAMGGVATAIPTSVSEAPSSSTTKSQGKVIMRPAFGIPPIMRTTSTLPNGTTTMRFIPFPDPLIDRSRWLSLVPREAVATATPAADKSLPVMPSPTSSYVKVNKGNMHYLPEVPCTPPQGPEAEAVQMGFTIDAAAGRKSAAGLAMVAAALAGVALL